MIWQVPRSTCHFVYLSPWLFMMIMLVLKSILRASTHPHSPSSSKIPLCLQGLSPFSSWQFTFIPSTGPETLSWDLLPVHCMYSCCSTEGMTRRISITLLQLNPMLLFSGKLVQSVFHLEIFLSFCLTLGVFRLPFYSISFSPLLGRKQRLPWT